MRFSDNKVFRGKTLDTQEWVQGYYCLTDNNQAIIVTDIDDDSLYASQDGKKYFPVLDFNYKYVDPDSVGMFVGKFDVNGKPIFEGDIFKDNNPRRLSNALKIVSYLSDYCYYPYIGEDNRQIEVVGNIIDNPEMVGL